MSDKVEKLILNYLNRVRKLLPDSFETDDLIDDLRIHIITALEDKTQKQPTEDRYELAMHVLGELGEPEDIAEEYGKTKEPDEYVDEEKDNLRFIIRLIFTAIVVIAASWFVSSLPNSIVDFWTALIVFVIIATAEYYLRNWQKSSEN